MSVSRAGVDSDVRDVVGRVIDRDEGTGVRAAIELRPAGDDQPSRYARSEADGVFRIEGVASGRWIADAFAPGYVSPGGVELEAGRGIPELALIRGAILELLRANARRRGTPEDQLPNEVCPGRLYIKIRPSRIASWDNAKR